MEVRQIKKPLEIKETSEERLVAFVEEQIKKMAKYAALNNEEGQIGFYELNRALAEYQSINLALISLYNLAKIETAKAINSFEEWFAEQYVQQRELLNPRSISSTKWYSTKEIELHVRTNNKETYYNLYQEKLFAEQKESMLRRLLDSWSSHQYILARLSKNVEAEYKGAGVEDLGF